METFLYNTDTNERVGPIRQGYFTVDGVRPNLEPPIVEIEIIYPETPSYDRSTQTIEYKEFLDLPNLKFVKGYVVRNLTQEEIDANNNQPGAYVPETCTPRQFRLALLDFDIDPDYITNFIEQIQDVEQRKRILIIWEYANSIERYDPLITQFAQMLNVDDQTIDEIFKRAITYL
jgi:hypothetical protein